jgi:hypothetical protein
MKNTIPHLISRVAAFAGLLLPLASLQAIDAPKRKPKPTAENQTVRVRLRPENHLISPMKHLKFFLATDVKTWKGNEFGFVKTFDDNVLKAYVQTPTSYKTKVISRGNSGFRTYKAIVDEKEHDLVHFYIGEKYVVSIRAEDPKESVDGEIKVLRWDVAGVVESVGDDELAASMMQRPYREGFEIEM